MNELQTTTAQNEVTNQLLLEYLGTLTESLNDNQRTQFLAVAKAFNLNPFKREIYAVKYGIKFNIIVGYETYIKRAEEFPQYDGYETEFGVLNGETFCKCSVYRKDRNRPTSTTVWMKEYNQNQGVWTSKPRMMLEKVAICTAFRRAFPVENGGMPYAEEEMPAAEKLQQQGLTEVTAEAESVRSFIRNCASENPAVFENFKNTLKNHGWAKPSDIPEDKLDEVKKMWAEAVQLQGKFENLVEEKEAENG